MTVGRQSRTSKAAAQGISRDAQSSSKDDSAKSGSKNSNSKTNESFSTATTPFLSVKEGTDSLSQPQDYQRTPPINRRDDATETSTATSTSTTTTFKETTSAKPNSTNGSQSAAKLPYNRGGPSKSSAKNCFLSRSAALGSLSVASGSKKKRRISDSKDEGNSENELQPFSNSSSYDSKQVAHGCKSTGKSDDDDCDGASDDEVVVK